jgi:hypothetical protein
MSITTRRLTPPHCVHGSAPQPTPSKAQRSMSYRSDTRLSLNKRLLLPNSISPMARSRLRARLLSSSLPIPLFFFTVDRSDRDSFISLKEFDGSLRTEPGHWPWRGQREGEATGNPHQPIEHRTEPAQVVGADTSGSQQGYYQARTRPVPFPSPWTAFTGFAPAVAQALGRPSRQSSDNPLPSDECHRPD